MSRGFPKKSCAYPRNMALTNEQRAKGTEVSQRVRQERIAERAQRQEVVNLVTDWADRENLSLAAMQAALTAIQRGSQALNDVPLETALDVLRSAEAARIWHSLMRLEMGESTSNVATSNVDKAELLARLGRIQESPDSSATST